MDIYLVLFNTLKMHAFVMLLVHAFVLSVAIIVIQEIKSTILFGATHKQIYYQNWA